MLCINVQVYLWSSLLHKYANALQFVHPHFPVGYVSTGAQTHHVICKHLTLSTQRSYNNHTCTFQASANLVYRYIGDISVCTEIELNAYLHI